MRTQAVAVAGISVVVAMSGCGGGGGSPPPGAGKTFNVNHGVETLVRSDPAKDVNQFGSVPNAPPTAALDLRKVTLRRDSRSLRVDLETTAPPRGHMTQSFVVFGANVVRGVQVQIDWAGSDLPRGRVSGPGQRSRSVRVDRRGSSVRFRLPLDKFSRKPEFKWRASTALTGSGGGTADTVPGMPENGSYELFSKPPG